MKQWLLNCYLFPEKRAFILLDHVRHYWYFYAFAVAIVINSYPVFRYVENYYQQHYLAQQHPNLQASIQQLERQKSALKQHHLRKNQQDKQLVEFDQQLKQIIQQENAVIEHMQWQFEQGKQLEISLQQHSTAIFKIIEQITQLEKLAFQEISLAKLHQQRRIQFSAQLLIQP